MRRIGLLALALSLSGCLFVRVPFGPAPLVRPMTRGDAISSGNSYCASRGWRCDLHDAHLTGRGVWKVKYKVVGAKGNLHLRYDSYSGSLISANENLRPDFRDDDDDDDDRGHGRGHGNH